MHCSQDNSEPPPLVDPRKLAPNCCQPAPKAPSLKDPLCFRHPGPQVPVLPPEIAIDCLCRGGYRISEILRLTWNDIVSHDQILVRASKKGAASLLHIPGISALSASLPPDLRQLTLFNCGYTAVYRAMLRKGYALHPEGHFNRSVTHTPRRLLAQAVAGMAGERAAGQVINHTSKTAVKYYLNTSTISFKIIVVERGMNLYFISFVVTPSKPQKRTIAWEAIAEQAGGFINSWGKGWKPGFLQHYDPTEPDPQDCVPTQLMLYPYWQIKLSVYYSSAVISTRIASS